MTPNTALKQESCYFDIHNIDNKIHATMDYEQFVFLKGNRQINDLHEKQIVKSMQENGILFNLVVVNENMEIIDGQHSFRAQKQLNAPIFYIMVLGYGLREVQVLNSETANWSLKDFLKSYLQLQNEYQDHYKTVDWFKSKYDWGYSDIISCLMGGTTGGSAYSDSFKLGKFEVKFLSICMKYAEQLISFGLPPFYKKASFLRAALKMFKSKGYKHKVFLKKLKYKGAVMPTNASYNDYMDLLEKVYNKRTEAKDKIRVGVE